MTGSVADEAVLPVFLCSKNLFILLTTFLLTCNAKRVTMQ